jgi:DNA-binding beta-propeller fold protein YncE
MSSSRRGFVGLALAALLLAGCSPRDHTNPFDPDHPDTRGRPDVVTAAAANGRVTLSWSLPAYADLEGGRLLRRTLSGGSIVLSDAPPLPVGEFVDSGVVNDSTYYYRLELDFAGDATPRATAERAATPGRRVLWVLDQSNGGPLLVGPDAGSVVARPGAGRPTDLAVHPVTGQAVSVDFFAGRVEVFDRHGGPAGSVTPGASVLSVAYALPGDSLWVGGFDPSVVLLLPPNLGAPAVADTGYGGPEDLAWDPVRRALWVADSQFGRLYHRRAGGAVDTLSGFGVPFSVAVDEGTGDAWLIDRSRRMVHRVDGVADTLLWSAGGFAGPYQLLPLADGTVWVSDNLSGRITRLAVDGSVAETRDGFEAPAGLALDPATGDLWVTDARRGELLRIGPAGEVRARLGGFDGPFAVGVAIPDDETP